MTRQAKARVARILTVTLTVITSPAFGQIPDGVSPGRADRIAEIEGRCPTFSWSPVPGAEFHELVGYRLPDPLDGADPASVDLSRADQVLYSRVPGGATAWEPELAECLTAGASYVWFVRAVYREDDGEVIESSEWSDGRFFSISRMPSVGEVEEALRVLRRYADNGLLEVTDVDPRGIETEVTRTDRLTPTDLGAVSSINQKSVTSAKTAIKGSVPDATGETYGVVGISNSADGSGIGAANTGGGADLVIDGSADGQPDAIFTQAGIDRASPSEQWFSLLNSDTGVLSLNVEGTIVGDGSGLTAVDADTLDGTEGSDFATDLEAAGLVTAHAVSGDHDGRYFTESELSTSGAGGAIHWGNLNGVPSDIADGDDDTKYAAGVGLKLDGTVFSALGSDFTPRDNTVREIPGQIVATQNLVTIGADGLPMIAFYDDSGAVGVARCSDHPCSEATVTIIGDVSVFFHGSPISLAIGSDGLALVAYSSGVGALMLAHCSDLSCTEFAVVTVDSAGINSPFSTPSVAIGADGMPFISYPDSSSDDLKVAHCSNLTCSTVETSTIDESGTTGLFTSVAIGADGLPVISYVDATNYELKVAHCSSIECGAATISTVRSAGYVRDSLTSIVIGTDGLPLIGYKDRSRDQVKVAHCLNLACTETAISTIDEGENPGASTSVAIGADGFPVVSYSLMLDGVRVLRFARCSDSNCTRSIPTSIATMSGGGSVGSICIGADGLPVISFAENGGLHLAHCANEFCVPYGRRR